MPKQMLAIFLRGIYYAAPIVGNGWTTDEFLCIGKEVSPLREEQIDDVEILSACLCVGALR